MSTIAAVKRRAEVKEMQRLPYWVIGFSIALTFLALAGRTAAGELPPLPPGARALPSIVCSPKTSFVCGREGCFPASPPEGLLVSLNQSDGTYVRCSPKDGCLRRPYTGSDGGGIVYRAVIDGGSAVLTLFPEGLDKGGHSGFSETVTLLNRVFVHFGVCLAAPPA
jgi:hypothetical protein